MIKELRLFSTSIQEKEWASGTFVEIMIVLALLSVIGFFAYALFFVPALFMDDWTSVVERIVTDNASWIDSTQRRPWLFSAFLLQNRLFGLNITAYYISLWTLYILMALVIYSIICRLNFPYKRLFAFLTSALFLVYPTNYTHMWLIMFGVYLGTLITPSVWVLFASLCPGG